MSKSEYDAQSHKQKLKDLGLDETHVSRVLSGEMSTYDAYSSQLIENYARTQMQPPAETSADAVESAWDKITPAQKQEFFEGVEALHAQLDFFDPDIVIFPLRGADPLRIGLNQLSVSKSQTESDYLALKTPLGNQIDLDEFSDGIGIWSAMTDEERAEIQRQTQAYNRSQKLVKLGAKEFVKKKVFDQYLDTVFQVSADSPPRRIALVDEVQTGGTISTHHKLLRAYLAEHDLEDVEIKTYAYARTDGGEFQKAKDYKQKMRAGEFTIMSGSFPTIDVPLLLPLVLGGDKGDYSGDVASYELQEDIGNKLFEDLLRRDLDMWHAGE